ncbi:MAG: response regulator transcription factor [Ignavibacteriaceae bacterium]|nr:response regulator transcription factor [Ignavibacteriaceae bacterium]
MENKKKILVTDDDPDILAQTKILLEARGYEVLTADNAEDAIRVFEKNDIYAAALDLIMEEMDTGFTLSYKIKKTEKGKNIPVMILTSATYLTGFKFDAGTKEEKSWLKCDAILNKPVNVDDLLMKIEEYYSN